MRFDAALAWPDLHRKRHRILLNSVWTVKLMSRSRMARGFAASIFLSLAWLASTQTRVPQLTTVKVKDHLFSIEGEGGNVGVLITSEGVILVDDKYDQDH